MYSSMYNVMFLTIYILGPTGVLIQQHHYQARPAGELASTSEVNNLNKENGSTIIMNNNHSIYQVDGKFC